MLFILNSGPFPLFHPRFISVCLLIFYYYFQRIIIHVGKNFVNEKQHPPSPRENVGGIGGKAGDFPGLETLNIIRIFWKVKLKRENRQCTINDLRLL